MSAVGDLVMPPVAVWRARHNAVLPQRLSDDAAGFDLQAALPDGMPAIRLPAARGGGHARALIPTGLHMAIPQGWEMQIRPRSGLALKKGITVLNAPGTIDADYRGEIGVILINFGHEDVFVATGDRIAQAVFAPAPRPSFVEVEDEFALGETPRGRGGFGSTG